MAGALLRCTATARPLSRMHQMYSSSTLLPCQAGDQHQVVVHVVLPGRVEGHPAADAAEDDQEEVDERHAEHEQRQDEGDGGGALHDALHAQDAEHEAEEHGAGVAHEDARRMEVEAQES